MTLQKNLEEIFLDMNEEIQSEVISNTRFDENSDISTTYVGKVDITRASMVKAEEQFLISE